MSKSTRNSGKPWTREQIAYLRANARKEPTRVLGLHLGRTEDAIYKKASKLGVTLKPTNQSPYNRRKR